MEVAHNCSSSNAGHRGSRDYGETVSDQQTDMPVPEFRRAGHDVIEWIGDYLEGIRDLPVLPDVKPGDISAKLPLHAPEKGEEIDKIMADFREIIVSGNTHWNHPRFHAYFSVSASAPGILAESLAAALNVNGMVWKSSPSFTELEVRMVEWLREWLGLPKEFFGVVYDTASVSTLHALIAARDCVDPETRTRGMLGNLTVYTSEHAHSSVEKGAISLGFGQDNVRKVPVDDAFRMRPDALRAMMEGDAVEGKKPCCVVPTIGTTSTASVDPVRPVLETARRFGAWVHVDGAYGGPAGMLPEFNWMMDAVDEADSIVVNPQKWMFTPLDCSVLYTRRPEVLRRALSLTPEYLKTREDGSVINLMDYSVPLGRRFRSLKLWFVMRYFGRERMTEIIRSHITMAKEFASWVAADGRFELCAPVELSLVCFRVCGSDEENRNLLDRVNASGVAFLSHTVLDGRFVIRMALGNLRTTPEDVQLVWKRVQSA
ncbi:MAG: amino acid decarboxylase [Bryobacteraceae bacterium]|nr:amino acid decarboxylase [Bryobacteraceae bacterium]